MRAGGTPEQQEKVGSTVSIRDAGGWLCIQKNENWSLSSPRLNIMGKPFPFLRLDRDRKDFLYQSGQECLVEGGYGKLQYCSLLSCWCRMLRGLTLPFEQ